MIRRFYVGLRSTTGKLCPRELSRRPHLHGDSSRLCSPPGSLSWQPVAGVSNRSQGRDERQISVRGAQKPPAAVAPTILADDDNRRRGRRAGRSHKAWPGTRTRIVMGTLKLIKVAEDQGADGERISFNPCRLQHGI